MCPLSVHFTRSCEMYGISSTEKRKGASLVRMMRPWLFLGTRGTVLILPSFSSDGERCNYPFRNSFENSPCRPFGTCGLAPLVGLGERLLDQLANDELHELRGLFDGNADGLGLVSDFSPEIRCEPDALFAKLMLDEKKRDLPFSDVSELRKVINLLFHRHNKITYLG